MFGKQRIEPSAPDSRRIQWLDSKIIVQQALKERVMFIRTVSFVIVLVCSLSASANILYVRDFGAVGDGSTDDSLAIRKAVSTAVKAGENTKLIFESNKTASSSNF